jgi:hypothetical protein
VTVVSASLESLKNDYLQGRSQPSSATYTSSGWEYEDLLATAFGHHLTGSQLQSLNDWRTGINDAIHAARGGRLTEADRGFHAIEAEIDAAPVSSKLHQLGRAFLEPGQAYLWYRRGAYDRAYSLTLHASSLADRLCRHFRMPVMGCHRVQLGLNVVRVLARRGEPSQAVQIAGRFLDYLEHAVESLPSALAGPRTLLADVPPSIAGWYFDRFCAETAQIGDAPPRDVSAIAARHTAERCTDESFAVHGHAWLRWIQTTRNQLAVRDQLAAASHVLLPGRSYEPRLWFASVLDVAATCRRMGVEGAALAAWMLADAARLPDAPPMLRLTRESAADSDQATLLAVDRSALVDSSLVPA